MIKILKLLEIIVLTLSILNLVMALYKLKTKNSATKQYVIVSMLAGTCAILFSSISLLYSIYTLNPIEFKFYVFSPLLLGVQVYVFDILCESFFELKKFPTVITGIIFSVLCVTCGIIALIS